MNQRNDVALGVSGVTKKFVKSEGPRWPWKKQSGNGRKPVVAVDSVAFEVRRGRLVLIGVIAIPVGLAIFRRAEKYAKRTGKLKWSG